MKNFTIILLVLCLIGCKHHKPSVSIIITGDLMPDRGIRKTIEKKGIETLFRNLPYNLNMVDYTVVNLECAVCDSTIRKENKKFAFRANPEWLPYFRKHGINIVSLANNHSGDYGESGLLQSLNFIRRSKMSTTGANENPVWKGAPLLITKGKIRIALFSASLLKTDSKYMNHASVAELEKSIRTYKTNFPHTVIVLMLHWGIEGAVHPTAVQIQEAHQLVDAGVDVLVGSHPHVVQPVERYKAGLIFYSLGNFIFDNNCPPENKGMMARLEIGQGCVVAMDTVTFNVYSGYGR